MYKLTKNKLVLGSACLGIFLLGIVVGGFFWNYFSACHTKFLYINPHLGCGGDLAFDKSDPVALRNKLNSFIDAEKKNGDISEASVYFRDLKDGPILGIDENELFISASLLKLPISVTFYKLAEEEMPSILTQRLVFELSKESGKELDQFFKPAKTAQSGSSYTINELIFNSLAYSDNMSNDVLKTYLKTIGSNQDFLLRTFKELGLIEPASILTSDISTRSYASIFRVLYNASYLSRDDSDKILSILAQSDFDQGIVAGVADGVKVANKFGERDLNIEKQLHDCGIIYYPDNPYLICVMTRGKEYVKLTEVIKQISSMVYQEMDTRAHSFKK